MCRKREVKEECHIFKEVVPLPTGVHNVWKVFPLFLYVYSILIVYIIFSIY